MNNKELEVVKSYLKILDIEFDFENNNLVSVINKNSNKLNYIGYYFDEKYNTKGIKLNKENKSLNIIIKESVVTVHYNFDFATNYNIGGLELNYNWFTTVENKIAYFIQDNDNIVITTGTDNKTTLKDNAGNSKTEIIRPQTLQNMDMIEIINVPVAETINFNSDISELINPYLKMQEWSLYRKK